jgi:hypothetical protein
MLSKKETELKKALKDAGLSGTKAYHFVKYSKRKQAVNPYGIRVAADDFWYNGEARLLLWVLGGEDVILERLCEDSHGNYYLSELALSSNELCMIDIAKKKIAEQA